MKKLITLTTKQIEYLEKLKEEKQTSFSEMLRRILDEYIDRKSEEKWQKN
jgi:hypothetical protein